MAKAQKFECETGAPGWNGEVMTLGVSIHTAGEFDANAADEIFNKRRVDLTLRITPSDGEDEKQKKLLADSHPEVRIECDIGGFSRSDTEISFKLKFPEEKLNGFDLRAFGPGRSGLLLVHGHKPIPENKKVTAKAVKGQRELQEEGATEAEEKAYKEGCEAAADGKKAKDNPYEVRTPERIAWAKGFEATEGA